jgi:DNA-binding NarL/FixJ family response regulator
MIPKYTVVIAEDHALMRAGLRALLTTESDIEIVGEAENGKDAIQLVTRLTPHLLLLDLNMPGIGGLEAIGQIRTRAPETKILVVTMHKADEYLRHALRAGASGYMLKESSHEELLVAVRAVLGGRYYLSPDLSGQVVNSLLGGETPAAVATAWDTLTTRERSILKLVAEGNGNKQIAAYLSISIKTVEKHRSSLMHKLGLRNAAMLTAYAIERGVVDRKN